MSQNPSEGLQQLIVVGCLVFAAVALYIEQNNSRRK